jgi:hypothetical protein
MKTSPRAQAVGCRAAKCFTSAAELPKVTHPTDRPIIAELEKIARHDGCLWQLQLEALQEPFANLFSGTRYPSKLR